ncbi:uncharacterized protein LOC121897894 [Thunnus maccoyii]|uniref:uncharacterized protein LOC121897894 n=1 Tax=Thunnus maccoyii TaxID=8240 RepID=UPI001C4D85E7|nr:uncharacterized protein LOC121897894 [Thunnus maccoyii]
MALPFGVSWLCTLLLWGCLCFPPQKGYNFAHGYSLNDDEFSSYAGAFGPQTSTQLNSGANHDSVSPRDESQDMWHQSFVSLQREPAHHKYNKDVISVNPGEDKLVQSESDSEQPGAAPTPFVQKHEQVTSGYQHPFGLLVKEHTQKKAAKGISFPSIKDFKKFIESMKSSFLTPGSDLSRHFHTARQTMKNEMASGAQNIKGESSNSAEEGSAHDDGSENEVWSEPMNSVFEQSEQGANYETPSESLSVPDPVIATAGLISPSVYESQDSGLGSAFYPSPQLAATEHVSSHYGHFSNAGFSRETPEFLTHPPHVHEYVQSKSYNRFPEQIPFSSNSYGEYFSSSSHVTASPLEHPISSAQDLSYYPSKTSSITPLTSEQKIQQPTYTSHSKDSPTGYQKPSDGFELSGYLQSESLGEVIPQNPPSSYGKSLYVRAPRVQHPLSNNIPDQQPTHGERPAPSVQRYQPTVGKESKDINFSPSVHLPSGSVSSSSNILSPPSISGHVGVQASSPHDLLNRVFGRKQLVKSHLMFTVKPSSSPHGSSRHNDYLGDQSVGGPHPSIISTRAKDEEKSDLSEQALVSAIQEPKHMTENTPIPVSSGLDVSFNSPTNLAPASLVGDKVMSRNFETQNMISYMFPSGIYGTRKPSDLFSTPLRQGISLNEGYVSATRADLLQNFIQPTKEQKRPANVNKKLGNVANRPLKPLSTSKVFGSTLSNILWRNDGYRKRPPLPINTDLSPPSVNAYIVKSRNRYVRGKLSLSETRYTPHLLNEGEASKDQWKPARRQRKYNITSHNVKELEEK